MTELWYRTTTCRYTS